jgi:hypothetical protein
VNARMIRVLPLKLDAEVYTQLEDGKNKLVKLDFNGFVLSVGQEVIIGKGKYKIQEITKTSSYSEKGVGYDLYTSQLNKSSMYILPLLGGNRATMKWNHSLVNCFIGTEEWGVTETILVWYRFDGTKESVEFEEKIMEHPNYIGTHDVDKYHVMYEFSVPERFKDDYYLLVDGKYSRIKEATKNTILDFHFSTKTRPLGRILYKDPQRKREIEEELLIKIPEDIDLLDPFYEKDELFMNKFIISNSSGFIKEEE